MAFCVSIGSHKHTRFTLTSPIPVSLYQMQAVAAELLERFEFALPQDKPHMVRAPGGPTMLPMVKGKEELGSVLPLRVLIAE